MPVAPYQSLYQIVQSTLASWQAHRTPDVRQFAQEHPSIRDAKSLLLDLIYEEYCQDREAVRPARVNGYLQAFPEFRESILRLLEVHSVLALGDTSAQNIPTKWPTVGETELGLEIVASLGRGSFSRVYLARQIDLGNRLVVAKFSTTYSDEGNVLGQIEHPSIMPVYSVGEHSEAGLSVLVMPFRGVATLLDVLDRCQFISSSSPRTAQIVSPVCRPGSSPLSPWFPDPDEEVPQTLPDSYVDWVLSVGSHLAEALEHVHARGIFHRDIKPSNVLLSWNGQPLLMDFNLAHSKQSAILLDGGTLAYMPPERLRQIRQLPQNANVGSTAEDLFSLGVVLYELLWGRHSMDPIGDLEIDAQIDKLLVAARFQNWPTHIDAGVQRVLMRCLASNPSDRGTASQLRQDLARCQSLLPRFKRYARQHPRRLFVMGSAAAAGSAVGGAYLWLRPPLHVRKFEQGGRQYASGDFTSAAASFTEVLATGEEGPAALFARGQTYLQGGKFVLAGEDFQTLLNLPSTKLPSIVRECLAYCHLRTGNVRLAADIYQAMQTQGDNPRIQNNLAYCLGQRGNHQGAYALLDGPIAETSNHAVLFHNRARFELALALKNRRPVSLSALRDMQTALQLGRNNSLANLDAAEVLLSTSSTSADDVQALRYLESAIDAGYSGKKIVSDARFARLKARAEFTELENRPAGPGKTELATDLTLPPPSSIRLGDFSS